jgi:hypothetical protein
MHMASRAGLAADNFRIAIRFTGSPASAVSAMAEAAAQTSSAEELVTFVPTDGWRKFDCHLSAELLRRSFALDWLDLAGAKRKIEQLQKP